MSEPRTISAESEWSMRETLRLHKRLGTEACRQLFTELDYTRNALDDALAVIERLGRERDTIADMLARHPLPERSTSQGQRISKSDFLLLMREAACRLRHGEMRGGWLERAMQIVNELDGNDDAVS